ncbi:hypothetical protein [Bordetella avium]|uniref:hypothetical protein n=1 Tax=Bordetella avium TaxID=521 RepID=UPI000FDB8BE7|nr:hypothetical protein [Bordetella avium]
MPLALQKKVRRAFFSTSNFAQLTVSKHLLLSGARGRSSVGESALMAGFCRLKYRIFILCMAAFSGLKHPEFGVEGRSGAVDNS